MEEKKKQEEKKEEIPVRLLERKLRYKGSVLEVYEDTVDVSGHVTHWDFIHHIGAAAVLPVLEDGKASHGSAIPPCSIAFYPGNSGGKAG